MARAMGVDTTGMSKMEASDMWFVETERLLDDLEIKSGNLSEQFGLKKEDIPHIVKHQYENDFPEAERCWRGCVSLPIYPSLSNDALSYICKSIRSIFAECI